MAHNASAFDTYVVLKNSPNWRRIIVIKNGKGIISLKFFIGYVKNIWK